MGGGHVTQYPASTFLPFFSSSLSCSLALLLSRSLALHLLISLFHSPSLSPSFSPYLSLSLSPSLSLSISLFRCLRLAIFLSSAVAIHSVAVDASQSQVLFHALVFLCWAPHLWQCHLPFYGQRYFVSNYFPLYIFYFLPEINL